MKLDDKIKYLIEVKAVGLTLKDNHLRQAIGYGASHGIPWIVLTNGIDWEIHKIKFEKPVSNEQTCSMNLLEMNGRKKEDAELLYLLCREGLTSDAIEEFHEHAQSINKFVIASIINSDAVLKVIRRELRTLSPGAKVSTDDIAAILPDVLKREVVEGESAIEAQKRVKKLVAKAARKKAKQAKSAAAESVPTSDSSQTSPHDSETDSE